MSNELYAAYKLQQQLRLKRQRAQDRGFIRNTRPKTSETHNVTILIVQAIDENVEMSTRLHLAVEMREKMFRLDVSEVLSLMTTQQHLVVKLAESLLHTSYVPLQQLFFMSLASLLSTLNSRRSEQTAIVRERFRDNIGQLDTVLLSALPVDGVVEVIDPGRALWTRKQVNALNRSTKVCRTYIVRKCWVSSCGKDKLMPIAVDEWLDFGETMLTFYHQLPPETILYNIPYICLGTLEFKEATGLALIFIKQVFGLDRINLIAFVLESTEFAEFRDTLRSVKPGHVEILSTPRIRTQPADFQRRVMTNEPQQPRSPVAHRAVSTIPTLSPVAKRDLLNQLSSFRELSTTCRSARLHDEAALGMNRGNTTITERYTFQSKNRRLDEETTQIILRCQRTHETSVGAASSNDQSLVLRTMMNPQPVRQGETTSEEVVTSSVTPPIPWNRIIWNQFCGLLQAANFALQRRPLLLELAVNNLSNDLTRAKAECLRDLRESMGYIEPEPSAMMHCSYWLIAILVLIPWGLLMIKMFA